MRKRRAWWARASSHSWLRINGPLLAPALFAGALIIFAEAISDYGTAATIAQQAGFNLVTYELYTGAE